MRLNVVAQIAVAFESFVQTVFPLDPSSASSHSLTLAALIVFDSLRSIAWQYPFAITSTNSLTYSS